MLTRLATLRFAAFRELKEEELARVRAQRARLFEQWYALPAGETLELEFPVTRHIFPDKT
ncbi:MAG: hypothetical protein L0Z52_07960 [Acidobacteria bacterium]|nr:hypothetical protein [Acidobacteriota bacterium]